MNPIPETIFCVYCAQTAEVYDTEAFHPYVPESGPFRLFKCRECGSLMTDPLPTMDQVSNLYGRYDEGMYSRIAELRRDFPLQTWFQHCLDQITAIVPKDKLSFTWVDVGAGNGIMSEMMMNAFPNSKGFAVDLHDRPPGLRGLPVEWIKVDLNSAMTELPEADVFFSITVLEHLFKPRNFLQKLLENVSVHGGIYLNCPRADAAARYLMGKRWPYYLPGEHITIPSIKGLNTLLQQLAAARFGSSVTVQVNPVTMPYPLGYYLGYYLGWRYKKYWWNPDIHIPTGLLEASVRCGL